MIASRLDEPEHRIRYAVRLLTDQGLAYICGWDLVPNMQYEMWVPRFAAGKGRSVPAPIGVNTHRRQQSALDLNPGAELQRVTQQWGWASTQDKQNA